MGVEVASTGHFLNEHAAPGGVITGLKMTMGFYVARERKLASSVMKPNQERCDEPGKCLSDFSWKTSVADDGAIYCVNYVARALQVLVVV